jgi:hypothetical protein
VFTARYGLNIYIQFTCIFVLNYTYKKKRGEKSGNLQEAKLFRISGALETKGGFFHLEEVNKELQKKQRTELIPM